jgi:hypothetical protein
MASSTQNARERRQSALHDGFLRHNGYRWLKVAAGISIFCIISYLLVDVQPRHNGGSWYGYTLGTIGAGLIVWLTCLGIRKRAITPGAWSLKAWTSAHVYLGLSLIVIGTLHTGFQFGWNVHTLAYGLMMLLSGIWGIAVYAALPAALSTNRDEMTETQMLDALRALDRQLHDAAQPLSHGMAQTVQAALDQDAFGGSAWNRLTGSYPQCATRQALAAVRLATGSRADLGNDPLEKVDTLLERKQAMLGRLRRHLRLRAMLEVWLYLHIPATIALLAALAAHIISVFFYW